ncbi:MAG: dicarboxylate/amino acid:cation symporter [Planctomycetes bacterium]|nr:dicarboxylate/amino acid:cation symporter [Planctomycetota bacterium]
MRKLKLHHWIFIGMGVGLVAGLLLNRAGAPEALKHDPKGGVVHALWWLDVFGKTLFIGSLKMIIAPLILASIIAGITSMPSIKELGAIGWKTFVYYFLTTSLAVGIGLAAVLIIQPGTKGGSLAVRAEREADLERLQADFFQANPGVDANSEEGQAQLVAYVAQRSGDTAAKDKDFADKWSRIQSAQQMGPLETIKSQVVEPVLANPFQSLVDMNSLGIIFFSIVMGLACLAVGDRARPVAEFFQGMNEVMMKITLWVMKLAPLAIGCIIASLVAKLGVAALQSLAWYCATVVVGIAIHVAALLTIVAVLGKMSPIEFMRGIWSAWLVAFSTTSSAATLPVTMECVTDNLKVSPKIANFALPIGATVNMDGTALYEGVAVIFLLQMYGGLVDVPADLTPAMTFVIFITAVLASVGAAAVPSAGLITMALVAEAVGLPLYYIFFIFSVDHLLDQFRTSTNVMGDAVGAVVVNQMERGKLGSVR